MAGDHVSWSAFHICCAAALAKVSPSLRALRTLHDSRRLENLVFSTRVWQLVATVSVDTACLSLVGRHIGLKLDAMIH